jgi:putative protease
MHTIPELLAPAGDLETALAAFESGADAVYGGLSRFNARERTHNFSEADFARLMAYARIHGKKVYLTLNTLVMDRELADVTDFLSLMSGLRPHAIIVQDFGILRLIREHFPELPIHASTQMAVHNSAGVHFLADKGISRVILERQVTLEELALIQRRSNLELEVFIHGALCCSLSGVCLFSSWMGGWSGNRGKCKQPCRRRYFTPDGNGFFFSTKDLYTLDLIPQLKKMGIASLKIEGRLRKADYVRPVVEAYRLMLDSPEGEEQTALKEARGILNRASGREWSSGFFSKKAMKSVINYNSMGSQGQWVGDVTSIRSNGFQMKTSQRIFMGDKLRVQPASGEEGPSFIVTLMRENTKPVRRSEKNTRLFIHCDKAIPEKGKVFRIGSPVKYPRINMDKIPEIRHWIHLEIRIHPGGLQAVVIDPPLPHSITLSGDVEKAKKHPVNRQVVEAEFQKLSVDGIGLLDLTVILDGDYFIRNKTLRMLRQSLARRLNESLVAYQSQKRKNIPEFSRKPLEKTGSEPVTSVYCTRGEQNPGDAWVIRDLDDPAPAHERLLPLFCPETRLQDLRQSITKAIQSGTRTFRVSSLYGFELLKEFSGIHIHGGFSLPVANSMAFQELTDWGADKILLWPELDRSGFESILTHWRDKAEILTEGRLPILMTRGVIPVEGDIRDSRGAAFTVVKTDTLTWLYPEKGISIKPFAGVHQFKIFTADKSTSGTDWNLNREWK